MIYDFKTIIEVDWGRKEEVGEDEEWSGQHDQSDQVHLPFSRTIKKASTPSGLTIHVHKVILSIASDVFEAQFYGMRGGVNHGKNAHGGRKYECETCDFLKLY